MLKQCIKNGKKIKTEKQINGKSHSKTKRKWWKMRAKWKLVKETLFFCFHSCFFFSFAISHFHFLFFYCPKWHTNTKKSFLSFHKLFDFSSFFLFNSLKFYSPTLGHFTLNFLLLMQFNFQFESKTCW